MNHRFYELDALRGLAALAVVLYHYTTRYNELFGHVKPNYVTFDYGYLGVNLFFIISGFVIFMTITKIDNAFEFAKKRVIRLYPAYIAAVIITFTLVHLANLKGRTVSVVEGMFNLTMLQGFLPGVVNHVDGAYWSLTVELTFYIFIGLILFLGLKNQVYLLSFFWLVGSSIFQVLSLIYGETFIIKALLFYSIADYAHLFVAGIMFYLMKYSQNCYNHVFIVGCMIYQFAFNPLFESFVVLTVFGLFYLLIAGKLSFLNNRVLTFFGAISYSLYLIHQNIGYIIISFLENNGFTSEIYLFVPVLCSIFLATLLTYFVENPTISYFKNKNKNSDSVNDSKNITA